MAIGKIVSGGRFGVERAALNAAMTWWVPHGGWCPKGRLADGGGIPKRYRLQEVDSEDPLVAVEANVLDSDGTVILGRNPLDGVSKETAGLARTWRKRWIRIDPSRVDEYGAARAIRLWSESRFPWSCVLHVTGDRDSSILDIERYVERCLLCLLIHSNPEVYDLHEACTRDHEFCWRW